MMYISKEVNVEYYQSQGKPIMARIKAKPMNRLPIPSVAGVGGMKNGYRTPPPPPVYDPSGYPPGQQRFLYTNGTTMPQTTMPPYPNQVHLYVSRILFIITIHKNIRKFLFIQSKFSFFFVYAAPTVLSRWDNAVGTREPSLFRYDWCVHDERNNATQHLQTT